MNRNCNTLEKIWKKSPQNVQLLTDKLLQQNISMQMDQVLAAQQITLIVCVYIFHTYFHLLIYDNGWRSQPALCKAAA